MIVGTPRSGTTLVQRLAVELPGVAVPPETHFFSLFLPRLLTRRAFPFRREEIEEEVAAFLELKTSAGLELDPRAVADRLGGFCTRPLELFGAIVRCLAPGAGIVGEKTPNHLLWSPRLAAVVPSLKFVVVVRDPRAVAASYRSTWGTRRSWVTAQRWTSDQRRALSLLAAAPARALLLRYEDVVRNAAEARIAIGRLLGLEGVAPREPGAPQTLAWETWKSAAAGEITTSRIDAWRPVLGEDESEVVAHVCRRTMVRFGYRPTPARRPSFVQQRDRGAFAVRRARKLLRIARSTFALRRSGTS